MTIKEVEKELGIPRASIRFYEKKQLLSPDRKDNAYRNYSEEDIAALKRIIVLRKIGLSVADIEELLNGSAGLPELVEKNIVKLNEQIAELNGALKISTEMKSKNETLDSFDENYWWAEISREEKNGSKFLNIAKDALQYEKKIIFDYFDLGDNEGKLRYSKKEVVLRVASICLFMGAVYFFLGFRFGDRTVKDFLYGFTWPFTSVLILTVFGLPLHFLEKKSPKAVKVIKKTGWVFYGILIIAAILFLILFDSV